MADVCNVGRTLLPSLCRLIERWFWALKQTYYIAALPSGRRMIGERLLPAGAAVHAPVAEWLKLVDERRSIFNLQTDRHSSDDHSGHWRIIMEMPETETTSTKRQVWNAGRTVGAKRALKPKQI